MYACSVVPEARLLRYAAELIDALDFLSANGIVHRNLQLSNILLDGNDHIKLSDYGLYYISNAGKEVRIDIVLTLLTKALMSLDSPM
jgi:TBC domain-containing protein kinase-like protein